MPITSDSVYAAGQAYRGYASDSGEAVHVRYHWLAPATISSAGEFHWRRKSDESWSSGHHGCVPRHDLAVLLAPFSGARRNLGHFERTAHVARAPVHALQYVSLKNARPLRSRPGECGVACCPYRFLRLGHFDVVPSVAADHVEAAYGAPALCCMSCVQTLEPTFNDD